jgi:peptide/nickel transport system substrate-binding protein
MRYRLAIALSLGLCAAAPAMARELTLGLAASPTSFDPHYHAHAVSYAAHRHVFEGLTTRAADGRLLPTLARSWEALPSGDGWLFRLDPAARFADGRAVTSDDVAASIARARTIPVSLGRWTTFLIDLAGVEILDPTALILRTHGPAPLLPGTAATILVLPQEIARGATTAELSAGRGALGSGPYRLGRFVPGEVVELTRDPGWWRAARDGPQPWRQVTARIIANDSARVAALLAGDVDFIEGVPPRDAAGLARRPGLSLVRSVSQRMVFLSLDHRDAPPAGFRDADGRPLAANPLRDPRVRRALSMGIDRAALVTQVMQGEAVATAQLLPMGMIGSDPSWAPQPLDRAGAMALLREAGWPGGFRMVLSGPNDRMVNDERVLQALAQMWRRIGIQAEVDAMSSSLYLTRFVSGSFGAALASWVGGSGEPSAYFTAMLARRDPARGRGVFNPGGYANPVLDRLIDRTLATVDAEARDRAWREGARIALQQDAAILPLYHQVSLWAMRGGLSYPMRIDDLTFAMDVRPEATAR